MEKMYTAFIKLFMLHAKYEGCAGIWEDNVVSTSDTGYRDLGEDAKKRCWKNFEEGLDSFNKYKIIWKLEFWALQALEILAPVEGLLAPLTKGLASKNKCFKFF